MLKAFKYRIYPTEEQKRILENHFGCSRFIYNWALDRKNKEYKETGTSSHRFALEREIKNLRVDYPFLKEACCQSLHLEIKRLDLAYKAFYKKNSRYPNFKSRLNAQSFTARGTGVKDKSSIKILEGNSLLKIPKIEPIKIIMHRPLKGDILSVTISKTCSGKYYAAISTTTDEEIPETICPTEDKTISIKYGIKEDYFALLSNGDVIEKLEPLKKLQKRLSRQHRKLSKKVKGSKNREKQRIKLAKLHEKISNQRKDFLHKLSSDIVNTYDGIIIKDEKIKKLLEEETKGNSKKLQDSSFGIFKSMLIYKSLWNGKKIEIKKD